jgi:hypothetical protein
MAASDEEKARSTGTKWQICCAAGDSRAAADVLKMDFGLSIGGRRK